MTTSDKPAEAGQQPAAIDDAGNPLPQGQATDTQINPIATLEGLVAQLESQQADLTDRLLRAHADMENLRKRTEREKADAAKYAITKFALDIVGIADNFQRAVAAVPAGAGEQEGPLKSVVDGVLMTERAFLQALERHGVRQINPQGEPFNPNMHQAVMEQDSAEVPAGTVLRVFQLGYMIEDRVLRPAMVVVARGGAKPPRPAEPAPVNTVPHAAGNGNAGGSDGGAPGA